MYERVFLTTLNEVGNVIVGSDFRTTLIHQAHIEHQADTENPHLVDFHPSSVYG